MTENNSQNPVGRFFSGLVQSLLRDLFRFVIAFAIGTGVAGAVCLYYGFPLALALFGGLIVLGVMLAFIVGS